MSDPRVPRHWIVAPWTVSPDPTTNPYGQVGAPVATLYGTVDDAKLKAREMAANAPGSVWVVYVAVWYAWTDETPVNLLPVVGAAVL